MSDSTSADDELGLLVARPRPKLRLTSASSLVAMSRFAAPSLDPLIVPSFFSILVGRHVRLSPDSHTDRCARTSSRPRELTKLTFPLSPLVYMLLPQTGVSDIPLTARGEAVMAKVAPEIVGEGSQSHCHRSSALVSAR